MIVVLCLQRVMTVQQERGRSSAMLMGAVLRFLNRAISPNMFWTHAEKKVYKCECDVVMLPASRRILRRHGAARKNNKAIFTCFRVST